MKSIKSLLFFTTIALFANNPIMAMDKHPKKEKSPDAKDDAASLLKAIDSKDIAWLQWLLDTKADANDLFSDHMDKYPKKEKSPDAKDDAASLLKAIDSKDMAWLQWLLDNKADANAKDSIGEPLLLPAIESKDPKIVQSMLDHKADANALYPARDKHGIIHQHPLLRAALDDKDSAIVHLLLAHNADPTAKDGFGHSLLIPAIQSKDPKIVQSMLDHKADANVLYSAHDDHGTLQQYPLLRRVVDSKDSAIVHLLLAHNANPNAKDNFGNPLLCWAIESKDPEIVQSMLDHKADANALCSIPDKHGTIRQHPLLRGALYLRDSAIVHLLLAHKADPTAKDGHGKPLLCVAIDSKDPKIIQSIQEHIAKRKKHIFKKKSATEDDLEKEKIELEKEKKRILEVREKERVAKREQRKDRKQQKLKNDMANAAKMAIASEEIKRKLKLEEDSKKNLEQEKLKQQQEEERHRQESIEKQWKDCNDKRKIELENAKQDDAKEQKRREKRKAKWKAEAEEAEKQATLNKAKSKQEAQTEKHKQQLDLDAKEASKKASLEEQGKLKEPEDKAVEKKKIDRASPVQSSAFANSLTLKLGMAADKAEFVPSKVVGADGEKRNIAQSAQSIIVDDKRKGQKKLDQQNKDINKADNELMQQEGLQRVFLEQAPKEVWSLKTDAQCRFTALKNAINTAIAVQAMPKQLTLAHTNLYNAAIRVISLYVENAKNKASEKIINTSSEIACLPDVTGKVISWQHHINNLLKDSSLISSKLSADANIEQLKQQALKELKAPKISPEVMHLFDAVAAGNISKVEYWLGQEGVHINSRNINGQTPLMIAVLNDDIPMAKYLIQRGADIDSFDVHGLAVSQLVRSVAMFNIVGQKEGHADQ